MEIRELAIRILSGTSMEEKLLSPEVLTDDNPGPIILWDEPSRPAGMQFKTKKKGDKLPSIVDLKDVDKRAICLHRFAGHELLAVEIMAYTLLRFPDAPKTFRKGLAHTLMEEQEHVRLYCTRLEAMGLQFGDLELYKHFWTHTPSIITPLHYVSLMSLTFEMANLDFAPYFGKAFNKHEDFESEALMKRIFTDEISHVHFGYKWFQRFKEENPLSEWQTWVNALPPNVAPKRAKGAIFSEEPRIKSGLSQEWVKNLKEL